MIFPHTQQLREIIESYGWTIYQVPNVCPPWDVVESRGPAEHLEIGHHCVFTPITKEGQSLREAYSMTKGLGPSLYIDPEWEGIEEIYRGTSTIEKEDEVLFSRIWIPNQRVTVLMSPKQAMNPDSSAVSIPHTHIVKTFEKYFRIVSLEEYSFADS
jgi:hypothetical protein